MSTAVASGDLSPQITVAARGEIADLKDTINQMIAALRTTTEANAQQGWLDSNLARIGGLLQGQRDLGEVCSMIMDEVAPLVDAQVGAFFLADPPEADPTAPGRGQAQRLVMCAGYAVVPDVRRTASRRRSGSARASSGRSPRTGAGCWWTTSRPATCRSARGSARPRRARWSCSRSRSRAARSASSSSAR